MELDSSAHGAMDPLFMRLPVPMFRSTPGGVWTQCNSALAALVGASSPADLVGTPWLDLCHPARLAQGFLDKVLAQEGPCELRISFTTPNRERTLPVLITASRVSVPAGPGAAQSYVVEAALQDRTRSAITEQLLLRVQAGFHALCEASADAMVVHRDGVVVYANPATVRALGYQQAEDLLGLPVLCLVHAADRPVVVDRMRTMAKGEVVPPARLRFLRQDSTVVTAAVSVIPVMMDGQPCVLVQGRDLGPEEQLKAAQAQAERLSSMGLIAASVAHEVNNPLAYTRSNLTFCMDRMKEVLAAASPACKGLDGVLEALAEAAQGAGRISEIVRDIRTFSSGSDATVPTDVKAVVESAIRLCRRDLSARARLTVNLPAGLPPIAANPSRLGQVFLNLIMNAVHAIPEGDPSGHEVSLGAHMGGSASQPVLEVTVSDTGVGMAPEVLERLCEPFFTTKPAGEGTGLGLSISNRIVKAMGGTISARSTPGAGSTFTVTLPAGGVQMITTPDSLPAVAQADTVVVRDDGQEHGPSDAQPGCGGVLQGPARPVAAPPATHSGGGHQ